MAIRGFLKKITSLRISLVVIVLLCWLIPTALLGVFMGTRSFGALQEKTEAFLTAGAEHAKARTLENIDKVVTLAKDAIYDGELATATSDYENEKIKSEIYFRLCRSYLERKYGREPLCDFAIFFRTSDPQTMFFSANSDEEAAYFGEFVQPNILELGELLDTQCYFFSHGTYTYLVRNLHNTRLEKYGMLVLGIDPSVVFAHLKEWSFAWDTTYAVKLDEYQTGNLSYLENAKDGLGEAADLLLYTLTQKTKDYNFAFQVQADKKTIYHEMENFRVLMIWLFILLVPIYVFIMYFVNRRMVRPIQVLSHAASRIQEGEFGITVPLHGQDELCQLGNAFSDMSMQLKTLVDQSYKGEIALRDARIQAMQSRLNPHFLNNALENINWQARMEENKTISEMVEALSVILNATMDRGEQHLVPLQEELNIAKAYFYFVGLRFGARLTVWQDVREALAYAAVPRLAIQTLLENAIEHGISPMGGGRIQMNIFAREETLVIEVVNNGRKLSEEDRQRISRLLGSDSGNGEYLGIRNIARRLRLLYDGKASLTIHSDAHGDTVASLWIPLEILETKSL